MPRRPVTHGSFTYTISDDDAPRRDALTWAVLRLRVTDELTGAPPRVPVTLTSNLPASTTRHVEGGICGLVARPRDVAQALVRQGRFTARLDVPGYLSRDLTPAIETARRSMTFPAPAATPAITVAPPDPLPPPLPRQQFTPGRGVLAQRPSAQEPEDFAVVTTDVPLGPSTVPITEDFERSHGAGTGIAGVPMVLDEQRLHRAGTIRIRGRLQLRAGLPPFTLVPAAGALIGVRGIWRTYPASTSAAPQPPDFCAVTPPLRFAHPNGAQIQSCTIGPLGGPRRLVDLAPAGTREIVVAPHAGLTPGGGDRLRLGDPLTSDHEVVVTTGYVAPADPNAPVRVGLTAPTAFLYRADADVIAVQPAALVPVATVTGDAQEADAVAFAAGIGALPTTTDIAVEFGTPREAFYRATQFPMTPDGIAFSHQVTLGTDGGFEWPPMARVAQLRVSAALAGHPSQQIDVALDYGGDNRIAIVFI